MFLPEEKMNAVTGISGSSPAYFYLFLKGIIEAGVKYGIEFEDARKLATATMIGAGKMLQKYADPVDLKNKVCSPGGTTLAGVAALEEGNLEEVAASAVAAAHRRTLELKK